MGRRSRAVTMAVLLLVGGSAAGTAAPAAKDAAAEDLFTGGVVPRLHIRIPAEGLRVLRGYHQVWGQPRPERVDVRMTVREGAQVYMAMAEFERSLIRERVMAGLAAARARGQRLGRPATLKGRVKEVLALKAKGLGVCAIARALELPPSSVHKVLSLAS